MAAIFAASCASAAAQSDGARQTPVVKAVEEVLPSVVNIGTERIVSTSYSPWAGGDPFEGLFRDFFAEQGEVKTYSLGSGSVIDDAGLIITNAHVVSRASKINIILEDEEVLTAETVASDELNDIALLRLTGPQPKARIRAIRLAKPDDLLLGEPVIAVGNPYGLGHSVASGILSAKGRKATFQGQVIFSDILQTDAAINPGNSGGPLININAEMIGMNTAMHKEAQGIGFAIPLRRIENVLAAWLVPEKFSDVSLGIIPGFSQDKGGSCRIIVEDLIEGSPAAAAGLKKGDEIKELNGKPVSGLPELGRVLWKLKAGDTVTVKTGDGRIISAKVAALQPMDGAEMARVRLGLTLQALNRQLAEALDYPFDKGLIVGEAKGNAGEIVRGDILLRLNNVPVNGFQDIPRALQQKRYGDEVSAVFGSIVKKNRRYFLLRKDCVLKVR